MPQRAFLTKDATMRNNQPSLEKSSRSSPM